jgi:hypothetical protein
MDWIRRNLVTLIVLLAVALSFVVSRADNENANDRARANNIKICQIGNERGALVAAWQRRAARARRAEGDIAVSKDYKAFARGSEEKLAIARYIDNPVAAAHVKKVSSPDGLVYKLTSESKALIRQGCEQALSD